MGNQTENKIKGALTHVIKLFEKTLPKTGPQSILTNVFKHLLSTFVTETGKQFFYKFLLWHLTLLSF